MKKVLTTSASRIAKVRSSTVSLSARPGLSFFFLVSSFSGGESVGAPTSGGVTR